MISMLDRDDGQAASTSGSVLQTVHKKGGEAKSQGVLIAFGKGKVTGEVRYSILGQGLPRSAQASPK